MKWRDKLFSGDNLPIGRESRLDSQASENKQEEDQKSSDTQCPCKTHGRNEATSHDGKDDAADARPSGKDAIGYTAFLIEPAGDGIESFSGVRNRNSYYDTHKLRH